MLICPPKFRETSVCIKRLVLVKRRSNFTADDTFDVLPIGYHEIQFSGFVNDACIIILPVDCRSVMQIRGAGSQCDLIYQLRFFLLRPLDTKVNLMHL